MTLFSSTRSRAGAFAVSVLAAASLLGATSSLASADTGSVFTQTNSAAGNAVLAFDRAPDGHLIAAGSFATGGLGSGTSLGSQGPVAVRGDTVYAVDAGSGDIAALRATRHGLLPSDREPAGAQPISVTVHGSLLYALDAGNGGQILGYRVRPDGGLKSINRSARPLGPGASGPAEVSFSPDGRFLAVTEKDTNHIDTYKVLPDGRVSGPVINTSAGATPFGFAFDPAGRLIVSEAGASTASSYTLTSDGALAAISAQIPTLQGAACWVAITPNGRFAYTGNGGGSVTAFAVSARGELTRLQSFASPGANEVAISPDGSRLYVENPGPGTISAFSIGTDGLLTALQTVTGLPTGLAGIAAS